MCSAIAVTFNPRIPFSCQRTYLGIFPIGCFLRDNGPKIEHYSNLIDIFIEFMNKESVLYISFLECISGACLEIDIRVKGTILN